MFDGALHGDYHSPSLPPFPSVRQPSPGSASSVNGSHLEAPLTYETLLDRNNKLNTRVTELELINNLFRDRVAELEHNEQEARRAEKTAKEIEAQLRAELHEVRQREADLKRRLDQIEGDEPRHKKMRLSDIVDESEAAPPVGPMLD